MSNEKDVGTIKCRVIADQVFYSKESRFLVAGDVVEFPAKVKDHKGDLVPFKVGPSFEVVKDEKKGAGKAGSDGGKPADGSDLT